MAKKLAVIVGLIVGLLALVVLIGALYVGCQLETLVEEGIEQGGSAVLGTKVDVGAVELSLLSGEGALKDLSIANPEGYRSPHIFKAGQVDVSLDAWSAVGSGPVLIRSVIIEEARITVEASLRGTNVGKLRRNLESEPRGDNADTAGSKRKLIIERFDLKRSKIDLEFRGPIGTVKKSVDIPDIVIQDIGRESGGAIARDVARQIFVEVAREAKAAAKATPGPWQNLRNTLFDHLEQAEGNGLEKLRNVGVNLLNNLSGALLGRGQSDAGVAEGVANDAGLGVAGDAAHEASDGGAE